MPTSKSRRSRTGRRGKARGGGGRGNLALSLFDSVGRQFATRGDRITLKGKLITSFGASGSIQSFGYFASSLGSRLSTILSNYSRFRLIKLVFRMDYQANPSITGGAGVVFAGILDDYGGEGGAVTLPTTSNGVLQLRCSAAISAEAPTMLQWDPVDKDKWYYVDQGASGTDPRFTCQATLVASAIPTSDTVTFTTYLILEAEGAVSAAGT